MVPVEKMQELSAVVNFWKSRVDTLNAELDMMQDLRAHGRPSGDRYAADRLLRDIKRKTAEIADTTPRLLEARRDLGEAIETTGHLVHALAPQFDRAQAAH